MDPDNTHPPVSSTPVSAQCDECAAPVDEEQRYCVVCGAHRRHVNDPATRYLSQLSARSRSNRAAATARRRPRRSGMRGLGIAIALALVPAIAAIGVLAGRSSNGDDAHLIQALSRQQAAIAHANASAASTQTTTSAAQPIADSGDTTTKRHRAKSKAHHGAGARKATTDADGVDAAKPPPPVTAAKATPKQKATGASVTDKVQKSKGKSYVHQQSGLPGTVVVP